MTKVCPASRTTFSFDNSSEGPTCFFCVCVLSLPGVLMPNTWLGVSLLADDVVVPLISSSINPCSSKVLLNGCIGNGMLS